MTGETAAVGPIFVDVGTATDQWVVDIVRVSSIARQGDHGDFDVQIEGESWTCTDEQGKKLMEAMIRLNPCCNHCGQGSMHCDHCGAPL